ncbi:MULTISPECIES: type II toxin-antitoxin system PemK/MazF family toxin [Micromonosporaceae]|uniref:type II toxin-antitoxin system PemK/MazF family toxin n=1 Tax=Micromonosporaceae TaxID=28056 RepID=UPI0024177662|nr:MULTISPECIES: type II toxin-antitoxin system PemK/MazF family toxin [unclassified Solwaraspora]MDG4770764.1 type II toxin-antitoxin system PemK/MazF family toxin [Solwaraspora sp. WMMD792]WBB99375.1 type II toxin-antitoxin system PemK/MazF family toxin [Solwaraspora sp. WMMA2059]WBC22075.1 type II toxin-antitoxin system PemK/MazF family toxin [Solwaraspora sp. WMMA2080]WFE20098.1 type II toxin-antitoxin system PemK/MazF family toxin [Solwaraspora sp. WMMD937]WJK35881.1 type II toxin-antitox
MNRGEIWTVGERSDLRYRVVVLSGDTHNERPRAAPYCAPIVRQRGATSLPPFVVPLAETDPLSGVVVVNRMRRISGRSGAERVGMVTGASMARLEEAMRDLFDL